MAAKNFIPIKGISKIAELFLEKRLLEKFYPFLSIKIIENELICIGSFSPSETSIVYKYKVIFTPGNNPKVFVMSPLIKYNDNIHMYGDKSLCLYYPKDFIYNKQSHLFDTIIPWTHEWFVFYELYLLTGKWLHPFVEHNKI